MFHSWGAWVAQIVKCSTLGFGSGHDLMVSWVRAHVRALTVQSLLGILCLPLSLPLSHAVSVSLKLNKLKKKKKKKCSTLQSTHADCSVTLTTLSFIPKISFTFKNQP